MNYLLAGPRFLQTAQAIIKGIDLAHYYILLLKHSLFNHLISCHKTKGFRIVYCYYFKTFPITDFKGHNYALLN